MGAFDNTSYNSLWLTLLGIIFLVMAGLGLSLLGDGLIGRSTDKIDTGSLRVKLIDLESQTEELGKKADLLLEQYKKKKARNQQLAASANSLETLTTHLKKSSLELNQLKKSITLEKNHLAQVNDDFRKLREQTRALLWASGRGRSLMDLPNPKGGNYEGISISSIDATGILIRHRTGTTRLSLHQIPNALIEEFDLRP